MFKQNNCPKILKENLSFYLFRIKILLIKYLKFQDKYNNLTRRQLYKEK